MPKARPAKLHRGEIRGEKKRDVNYRSDTSVLNTMKKSTGVRNTQFLRLK